MVSVAGKPHAVQQVRDLARRVRDELRPLARRQRPIRAVAQLRDEFVRVSWVKGPVVRRARAAVRVPACRAARRAALLAVAVEEGVEAALVPALVPFLDVANAGKNVPLWARPQSYGPLHLAAFLPCV